MKKIFIAIALLMSVLAFAQVRDTFGDWTAAITVDPMDDSVSGYYISYNQEAKYESLGMVIGITVAGTNITDFAIASVKNKFASTLPVPKTEKTFKVTYRFDKNTPVTLNWITSDDGSTLSIPDAERQALLDQLIGADVMVIRVTLKSGYIDFVFNVGGFLDVLANIGG